MRRPVLFSLLSLGLIVLFATGAHAALEHIENDMSDASLIRATTAADTNTQPLPTHDAPRVTTFPPTPASTTTNNAPAPPAPDAIEDARVAQTQAASLPDLTAKPVPANEPAAIPSSVGPEVPLKEPATTEQHAAEPETEHKAEREVEHDAEIEPPSTTQSSTRYEFLALHNDVRKKLGIPPLSWSDALQKDAQQWANTLKAEGCPLRHSVEPYGENLFSLWSSDGSVRGTAKDAMEWWVDGEAPFYDYDTNTCEPGKECGHYTQVVWRTTTTLGCAVATCTDDDAVRDVFVCRYSPQGNIIGTKPY